MYILWLKYLHHTTPLPPQKQLKVLEATVVPQIQQCQAEINRLKQELQYESRLRSLEDRFEQLNK